MFAQWRGLTIETLENLLTQWNQLMALSHSSLHENNCLSALCDWDKDLETLARKIFTNFIQLLFKIFRDMQTMMFPERAHLSCFIPKVFKAMQNIYCTVDCTEFKIECWRNFARQGNTFSSYTHCNILKCLIAVTPNSGACFVLDLFEGDINDVQIFKECGNLRYLHPGDVVMADGGLTGRGLLNPRQVTLTIPSLKGRTSLTAAEELETWRIAKARTHVEHFNERLKQFRLVESKLPSSLAPLSTQLVVVAACLVNFQETLCK